MSSESELMEPGDFYMEGPYMVFTAQYHLRRGFCCKSNCRHCPYDRANDGSLDATASSEEQQS